jgi:hypothetical protein
MIEPPPVFIICSAASFVPRKMLVWVDVCGHGLSATGANIGGYALSLSFQNIGDNDLCALRCEQARFCFAHAMGTASDDGNFVFQAHDSALWIWLSS